MSTNTSSAAIQEAAKMQMGGDPGFWLGPFMIAFYVDSFFLGIMMVSAFQYYQFCYPTDRWPTRALVIWIVAVSIGYTVFWQHMSWGLWVYGFGNWAVFSDITYLIYIPLWDSLMYTPIQCFYAWRAYHLNGSKLWLLGILGALMRVSAPLSTSGRTGADECSTFGLVMPFVIIASAVNQTGLTLTGAAFTKKFQRLVYIWLASLLSTDITLTGVLMYGLSRSRTGWSQTDALVKRLVLLVLETQTGPLLITFGFMIQFIIKPNATLAEAFEIMLSKVYVVGLLITLNSRISLRKVLKGDDSSGHGRENTFALSKSRFQQATVMVDTEVHVHSDYYAPSTTRRLNRDLAEQDIKEEYEDESEVNVDYGANSSKTGLNDESGRAVRFQVS